MKMVYLVAFNFVMAKESLIFLNDLSPAAPTPTTLKAMKQVIEIKENKKVTHRLALHKLF